MSSVAIKLRIVGLYFNKTVAITSKPDLTVRDVMDEYISQNPLSSPGGLAYTLTQAYTASVPVITAISHNYSGRFDFEGDNDETGPADGNTLANEKRPGGIYTLTEELEDSFPTGNAGLAWQYYVVSPTGEVKSKTPPERKFKPFDSTPDYTLDEGDTITWRLVAIARQPDTAAAYEQAAVAE